jgi:tRNA threonylcarbamoyladenosine biosynthesis protein TsaE
MRSVKSEFVTDSPQATEKIARDFAKNLKAGSVVALQGTLGSGKTTFVKGLASGLGIKDFIKSPTYNLMHIHEGRIPLYHFDLYRLDECNLDVLGFSDYIFDGDGVAVIEWPEKILAELPRDTYHLKLDYVSDEKRKIRIN